MLTNLYFGSIYLKVCVNISAREKKSPPFSIMKYFPVTVSIGLAFICQMAMIFPVVHASVGQCYQPFGQSTFCQAKGRVIYHQTMTPSWLEAYASYIDTARSQLTFNAGSAENAALLKVPMIPFGVLKDSAPLTMEITVANDVTIGQSADSDIRYGVSDGTRFVGFQAVDKANYPGLSPCYGAEGKSGSTLTSVQNGNTSKKPGSDSFYPGQFVFTLKLDERWGSCYTAHDGGFTRETGYNNRLMISKGLTLEVYKSNKGERVGIKYIKVTIMEDE